MLSSSALFGQEMFAAHIRELATRRARQIRILEAGCGRRWTLDIEEVDYHLTGIEIDERALRARVRAGDLTDWVLGDLRTVEIPSPAYDVVFCSYVLEHVHGAEEVLTRLVDAMAPGGLLLLRVPDRDSVFGFITRVTPFRLHVLYKRRIAKHPHAGEPGHDPYPTVYDRIVSTSGIHRFCAERGLIIREEMRSPVELSQFGRARALVRAGMRAIQAASLGKLSANHGPVAWVIEKP
jgi:SAM-dependent methyltransferase